MVNRAYSRALVGGAKGAHGEKIAADGPPIETYG